MSGLPSFPRRLAPWLWGTRTFCLALAVCAAGVALVVWFRSEQAFRWVGLALQLAGVATVAYGIRTTRSLFEQPKWPERLGAWWRRRPKYRLPTITGGMSTTLDGLSATFDANLRPKAGSNSGLERRIQILEWNLGDLDRRFSASHSSLSKDLQEASTRLETEAQTRTQQNAELDRLLRTAQVGGLDISAMGLAWLALGLVLATGSGELHCLLTYSEAAMCPAATWLGL